VRFLLPCLLLAACDRDIGIVQNLETESFTPGENRPPADLVFVVDNSPSMSEEHARLATSLDLLLDRVLESGADLRVGVVTTDMSGDDAGTFLGGMFTVEDPDLAAHIGAALDVGTYGARDEQGLAALIAALDGRNGDFPREEARVDAIFFSDEDDQSAGEPEDLFATLTGIGARFRAHGVIGDMPAGCFSPDGAADAALRYVDLIDRTDGYDESICAPDYGQLLERLGLDIAGIADTFPLQFIPEVASIDVTVDGVTVQTDPVDGWTYEPAPNAVVFHGVSIPDAGHRVQITYARLSGSVVTQTQ
jgi:hypothetical protein